MSFAALFGAACEIDITFTDEENLTRVEVAKEGGKGTEELCLFTNNEDVSGVIELVPAGGKTLDHLGVKVELIGQIGAHHEARELSFCQCLHILHDSLYRAFL